MSLVLTQWPFVVLLLGLYGACRYLRAAPRPSTLVAAGLLGLAVDSLLALSDAPL